MPKIKRIPGEKAPEFLLWSSCFPESLGTWLPPAAKGSARGEVKDLF